MATMQRWIKHSPITSLQLGWIIFGLGIVWDLVYHTTLFLVSGTLPSTLDLIGSFGHTITFGGGVVIVYALLRRHGR